MKKLMLIFSMLACGITITEATAQPLTCPFIDYFTVSGPSRPSSRYVIKNLRTDGNLSGTLTDTAHFTTACKNNSDIGSGYAYLTITSASGLCMLKILDGPFVSNPNVVSAECTTGLKYTGLEYSTGGYDYTLKFA